MAQKITYSANFKRNYMAFFAIVFFCLMLLSEFFLAMSIPRLVNREEAFANAIRKREMFMRFDETRRLCEKIPETDDVIKQEKKLLSDTLDILAIYLRKESLKLSVEEVKELAPLVTDLFKIASKLNKNKSYTAENKLDSTKYMNHLIKTHGGLKE